ncbi:hypothetical protein VPH35_122736 [Triticum aestivum]
MAAVAVGIARCSGILLILILSVVMVWESALVVMAWESALVGDRCAVGSQSPCGAGMHCASCSPLVGAPAPPPRLSSPARPRGPPGGRQVRRGLAVTMRRRHTLRLLLPVGRGPCSATRPPRSPRRPATLPV